MTIGTDSAINKLNTIDTIEKLEQYVTETIINTSEDYSSLIPSISNFVEACNRKLDNLREVTDKNQVLNELPSKFSNCANLIKTLQQKTLGENNNNTIDQLVNTFSHLQSEADESAYNDLEEDFEMINNNDESDDVDSFYYPPDQETTVQQNSLEDYNQRNHEMQLQDASVSTLYSLYDNTWDLTTTLSMKAYGYFYGQTVNDIIDNTSSIPEEYAHTVKTLIENLGSRLSTSEVVDFIIALGKTNLHKDKAQFLAYALTNKHIIDGRRPSELVETYLKNRYTIECLKSEGSHPVDLLFIPFVYKGSSIIGMVPYADPGHITLVAVCFSTKTVEYYDSFGFEPESWTCYENFCMKEELEKIRLHCFGKEEGDILTPVTKQQHDWHSCGVFVIWYILQRLNGQSYESITNKEMTSTEIEYIRTELGKLLANPKQFENKINLHLEKSYY